MNSWRQQNLENCCTKTIMKVPFVVDVLCYKRPLGLYGKPDTAPANGRLTASYWQS